MDEVIVNRRERLSEDDVEPRIVNAVATLVLMTVASIDEGIDAVTTGHINALTEIVTSHRRPAVAPLVVNRFAVPALAPRVQKCRALDKEREWAGVVHRSHTNDR
jgi:hypothetical protein